MGFTKEQVLKLWGEIFYWSLTAQNLKQCKHENKKTRWEVFKKTVPNVQEIRMLPIFAFVMVLRHSLPEASLDGANREFLQYGLYVGPDLKVKGAIRAAVLTGNGVFIIVTTKYKGVTDGGGIDIYPKVQRGLTQIIEDQEEIGEVEAVTYEDREDVFDTVSKDKKTQAKTKTKRLKKTNNEETVLTTQLGLEPSEVIITNQKEVQEPSPAVVQPKQTKFKKN